LWTVNLCDGQLTWNYRGPCRTWFQLLVGKDFGDHASVNLLALQGTAQ
jgi:hypothetical protein